MLSLSPVFPASMVWVHRRTIMRWLFPCGPGMQIPRDQLLKQLVENHYERNEISFFRGNFRVRGDMVEIFPASSWDKALRIEFFGDEIERIIEFKPMTGEILGKQMHAMIFPASHFVTTRDKMLAAAEEIEDELTWQLEKFKQEGKLLEAQRIEQRTRYDLEMIKEIGYCKGIENYSRYITGRQAGEPPYTLIDFFPMIFCFSWMNPISPCPRCGVCMRGTVPARRIWWTMVFVCLRLWTTAP